MDLEMLRNTPPWDWPEEASDMLLAVLVNDDATPADRLLAAELAGEAILVSDELVAALMGIVRSADQPEQLRCTAVLSLGPALEHSDMMGFDDGDEEMISEEAFQGVQRSLHQLYLDAAVPEELRRMILEASVRAPQDWHRPAIRAAYSSDDESWRLTAVFCMRFVEGFDEQILEVLEQGDPKTCYQAICAAGVWGVDGAWSHVVDLLTSDGTEKDLLLAAIEAAASIRPDEAPELLDPLADSEDEDIAEAALEAMTMAEGLSGGLDADEDDDRYDEPDDDEEEDELF